MANYEPFNVASLALGTNMLQFFVYRIVSLSWPSLCIIIDASKPIAIQRIKNCCPNKYHFRKKP